MSIILTRAEPNGRAQVFCQACFTSIGTLSNEEIRELSIAGVMVHCFKCGDENPDTVPAHLIDFSPHYFLGIGNYIFLVEFLDEQSQFQPKDMRMLRISLGTYFDIKTGNVAQARPLSSSLKVKGNSGESADYYLIGEYDDAV